jgi:hypothetical protein
MAEGKMMTAKTVFDFAITTAATDGSPEPSHRDLLILRLAIADKIQNFAFDRRMAERLSEALPSIIKKLAVPRHEN